MVHKVVCLVSLIVFSAPLIGCSGKGENAVLQASPDEIQAHEKAREEAQKMIEQSTPKGEA